MGLILVWTRVRYYIKMRTAFPIRLIIAAALVLLMATLLVVVLAATNLAFEVYDQLRDTSHWLALGALVLLLCSTIVAGILIWRLLTPSPTKTETILSAPEENQLRADIERYTETGIETQAAVTELEQLEQRRSTGKVYLALYGEISHGKTSLIRALIPAATPDVDIRGGTTRVVTHYTWQLPSGDRLVIADVPGFNQAGETHQEAAREEALRAHLVIYLCDGDLTRDQWGQLEELFSYGKPIIVAINKKDRYSAQDLASIDSRIRERLKMDSPVVAVQTGGREEIVRVLPDGREEYVDRERPADIDALVVALQNELIEQGEVLSQLRDKSVFLLAAAKLEGALIQYRQKTADDLVERYTRRAVIGGLAAFAPGSDLIIQGALAVAMSRALCNLYEVPFRKVDLDRLLNAAAGSLGKPAPLLLAVAGNALKAFPGMGTLAGGLAHAVAYGLLFQSLGLALVKTLSTQGKLDPKLALRTFEEKLGEDLAARAKRLAVIALKEQRRKTG